MSSSSRAPEPDASSSALSPEAILLQVDRITSSSAFARAERVRRFLRYIVEQRVNGGGEGLKEFAIGVAVFDRSSEYDPRIDPIVRVEASRLRTKLKEYYEGEGRSDAIRIELAKGSYAPVITTQPSLKVVEPPPAEPQIVPAVRTGPPVRFPRLGGMILFLATLTWAITAQYLLIQQRASAGEPAETFAPVWDSFLAQGQAETNVVFGSPMFFMDPTTTYFHRYVHLNEASNLQNNPVMADMQRRFGTLIGPRYDYVETGDALVLQRVTAFLGRFGAQPKAVPAHEAAWERIREGNILFIGSDRMVPLLSRLPGTPEFTFDADYSVVNRHPAAGEPPLWKAEVGSTLYTIVTKTAGLRSGRTILVLTSHSSPGTIAAADFLTRADTVRDLANRMRLPSAGGQSFQMVLRVYVDKGAAVKAEYVAHRLTN